MGDLYRLLGADFECDQCGRRHAVNVGRVIYGETAVSELPDLCVEATAGRRVELLADVRTHKVAGQRAVCALEDAGFEVGRTIVPDGDGSPVCDDITRQWIEQQFSRDPDLFVAVGSGVINDMTKWIAGDRGVPYIAVATAASMNGYASDNIAPTLKGVKSLLHGTAPVGIVAEPEVLGGAPREMTAAGLGDVIAKPVSTSDWRVNKVLFDEYYCPFCANLVSEIETVYLDRPERIAEGDPDGVRALFDALIFTGLSMSMAGTSSPASGGEHLISHTLDMMSMLDGTPHDLHGRQVGLGTILGAALYEEIFALENPVFEARLTETESSFWGRFTNSVEKAHAGKRTKMIQAVERFREDATLWRRVKEAAAPTLRGAAEIKDVLRRGNAAHQLDDIGVNRDRFLRALLHAHEIRERFTVLDLARCVGILPDRAEDLVDRWLIE